ncbi:CopD family protein [Paracoccus sp. 1_MG-2023]|uniref:CopD family protein n=1 Tax=unclassified Paracoccus (in: a-proteobacteria) TaxID=2688777 RepID=UPI001C090C69|nr:MULTISPECIES: CopD family protein [unclassified Paracoccus (in: a-proteobacteria)]MBU2958354.1 CopD family protein [Paracoccus sp. C2R09]MDO6670274.1 CopD family protein [Paracoccus sp. 1_MG-2023]
MSMLDPIIPHMKSLHVAMLLIWCAGLFALPLMLARHDPAIGQADYARIRRATHYAYAFFITPAAVIAIASGTGLIFLRGVFVTWLFAKLVFVAALVGFHVWIGYVLVDVAEREGIHKAPRPFLPLLVLLLPVTCILILVLAKPDLGQIPLPGWLQQPLGNQLPFDVPKR